MSSRDSVDYICTLSLDIKGLWLWGKW